jgi:hypothetical protein
MSTARTRELASSATDQTPAHAARSQIKWIAVEPNGRAQSFTSRRSGPHSRPHESTLPRRVHDVIDPHKRQASSRAAVSTLPFGRFAVVRLVLSADDHLRLAPNVVINALIARAGVNATVLGPGAVFGGYDPQARLYWSMAGSVLAEWDRMYEEYRSLRY